MELKDFKELIPEFIEALRDKVREEDSNNQITYQELPNATNIWKVSIRTGYNIEEYLIWTNKQAGPQWSIVHNPNPSW